MFSSSQDLAGLCMPPALSPSLVSGILELKKKANETPQVTDITNLTVGEVLALDPGDFLDARDKLFSPEQLNDPQLQELLDRVCKVVTRSDGEEVRELDFTGTPFEGLEEAVIKQMTAVWKKEDERKAGSSSTSA
jgi:hypothetical protein